MALHAVVANPEALNDTRLVAIVGNPNAGKTSLFNALTGSSQKVGNYPGVTVEKVSALLKIEGEAIECIDVPGLYSISPASEDERVAVEVILGKSKGLRKPDLLVCVLDASNLERNLFFYSQLVKLGIPILVALTMVDRVERDGRRVDFPRLTNLLGAEVVPVNGHKAKGMVSLKEAIAKNLENPKIAKIDLGAPDQLEGRIALLRERLARIGMDTTAQEVRESLFGPSEEMQRYIQDFPEVHEIFEEAKATAATQPPETAEPDAAGRYSWASMVQRATVPQPAEGSQRPITDRIDYVLTHRVFGLVVFLAVMYLVFQSIYTFAQPVMDFIDTGFKAFGAFVGDHMAGVPILKSLVVDGLIGGVGSMLVFLPQILILFFFIAFLEGTGYLARAAFLMDRLLGWCGLNGRAFIPLLSSFACAIPGIMAARVMPDAKSRLATILVAPLMSCSARLPVYLLLIGAFIEPRFGPAWAGFALFAMHLLGLLISIPIVWILNKGVLKGKRLPFLLELPPYQWPRWRDIWLAMYFRGKVFITTAGTTIVLMSILIWGLSFFPRSDEARKTYETQYTQSHPGANTDVVKHYVEEQQLAHSYLGSFGKAIEPVFRPAGFDWRITTAILSAFPARETVVPSLGIIFSLGGGSTDKDPQALQSAMRHATWPDGRPLMTPWTAVGLMVFFALCCQCMSTLATVKRETNSWKWPLFMFTYMTVLAYLAAVLIHLIGTHV
jgi:ferrous iron transport protein B